MTMAIQAQTVLTRETNSYLGTGRHIMQQIKCAEVTKDSNRWDFSNMEIVEQKHTVSNVTKGYLSTLRRTLSALLNFKLLKNSAEVNLYSQEKLNTFIDENCVLEWNYYPRKSKKELEVIEDGIINSGFYPLNIQSNKQTSKELHKKLGDMRKTICSAP